MGYPTQQFLPKIAFFCRQEWNRVVLHEKNFHYFQIEKLILQVEKKSRWKSEVICLASMFPSQVMVLELSKKVHFLQFCADVSKKPESIKANLSSHDTHLENDMVYKILSHR